MTKEKVMKLFRIFAGSVMLMAAVCAPAFSQETSPTMTKQEKENLKFVKDWWREVIVARHVDLAPKYQAEDYIQHNPNIPTGRDAFVKVFGRRPPEPIPDVLPNPPSVEFAKGDYVVLVWNHSAVDPTRPNATYQYNSFDVIRLQNGKVQEHWDSAKMNPAPPARGN